MKEVFSKKKNEKNILAAIKSGSFDIDKFYVL